MDDTGYHYFIDARLRSPAVLSDRSALHAIFANALSTLNVIGFIDHKFGEGGGVTGIFLLAESHCSYHTYPESKYVAIDLFTCGRKPTEVLPRLLETLDCEQHIVRHQPRGSVCIKREYVPPSVEVFSES